MKKTGRWLAWLLTLTLLLPEFYLPVRAEGTGMQEGMEAEEGADGTVDAAYEDSASEDDASEDSASEDDAEGEEPADVDAAVSSDSVSGNEAETDDAEDETSDPASPESEDADGDGVWKTPAADWYTRYAYSLSGDQIILNSPVDFDNLHDNAVKNKDHTDYYATIPGTATVDGKVYHVVLTNKTFRSSKYVVSESSFITRHLRIQSGVSFYDNSCAALFQVYPHYVADFVSGTDSYYPVWGDELIFDQVDFSDVTSMRGMFASPYEEYGRRLSRVSFIDCKGPKEADMSAMFYRRRGLTEVDLSGLDASGATGMDYMFSGCAQLESLDLSGFKTSNVGKGNGTYIYWVVQGTASNMWYLGKPGGMRAMFQGCSSLKSLDLGSFDTSNVRDMIDMFFGCSSLETLDLSHFATASITTELFPGKPGYELSEAAEFTGMRGMFGGCSKLKSLRIDHFDTSGIGDVYVELTNPDGSKSKKKPDNLLNSYTGLSLMFSGCSSLAKLDMSSFDLSNTADVTGMLSGCESLAEIRTPKNLPADVKGELPTIYLDDKGTTWFELPHLSESIVLRWDEERTAFFYDYTFEVGDGVFTLKKAKDTLQGNVSVPGSVSLGGSEYRVVLGRAVYQNAAKVTAISFGKGVSVNDCRELFSGCNALKSIDLSGLDLSNVTDMSSMFSGCNALESIDLSGLDLSNVTKMSSMFSGCNALKSIDLSGLDLSNVTDMSSMFSGCNALKTLNFATMDTTKLNNVAYMFVYCQNLSELDLSGMDMGNVTKSNDVFKGCDALATLHTPRNVSLQLPCVFFDSENRAYTTTPRQAESITLTADKEKNAFFYDYEYYIADGKLHLTKAGSKVTGKVTVPASVKLNGTDYGIVLSGGVYKDKTEITGITIATGVSAMGSRLFQGCTGLTEMDISGLDVSEGGLTCMFLGCTQLKSVKLGSRELPDISDMTGMFMHCSALTSLDLSGFTVPKLYNMSSMFEDCSSLTELKLGKMGSSYYEADAHAMFKGCSSLKTLDLSGLEGTNLKNMTEMFAGCTSLTGLDLKGLVTENTKEMGAVFKNCAGLKSVNLEGISTKSATSVASMFEGCSSLETLDVSGFDTANVSYMGSMFKGCGALKTLDLSAFDLTRIGRYSHSEILYGCSSLESLKTPAGIPSERTNNPVIRLPYIMYDSNGKAYTEIPHTAESIVLSVSTEQRDAWYQDYECEIGEDVLILKSPAATLKGDIEVQAKAVIAGKEYSVSLDRLLYANQSAYPSRSVNITGIVIHGGVYVGGDCGSLFTGCKNLKKLDLSGLDVSAVTALRIYEAESKLEKIETPLNLPERVSVSLPGESDAWEAFKDKDGKVYTELPHLSSSISLSRKAKSGGKKEEPESGDLTLNGEKVASLQEAFKLMKDKNTDYIISLGSDLEEKKNLSIPKTAKSITINGNGHSIGFIGTKLTAGAPLLLEEVNISAKTKKNKAAKFTLTARKGLTIGEDVSFTAEKTSVKATGDLKLAGALAVNSLTVKDLYLEDGAVLSAAGKNVITVKGNLNGNGGKISLAADFAKPIVLKGSVEGRVAFTGEVQKDGMQLLSCSVKKLPADKLKEAFDVSEITGNGVSTALYYFSGGKAGIFGESISYNGASYALWKDAVAAINADKKTGTKDFIISLEGDVNLKGAFKMPKTGYDSLTIEGGGHSMSFTGDIKLTGNTKIRDTTLIKLNKKNEQVSGKVKRGKYSYEGPDTF